MDFQSACTRMHEWRIQAKPIDQDIGQSQGQPEVVNLDDLTYRLKSGHNATLRDGIPLRNVNVTGNFKNHVHVNDSPLESCQ